MMNRHRIIFFPVQSVNRSCLDTAFKSVVLLLGLRAPLASNNFFIFTAQCTVDYSNILTS